MTLQDLLNQAENDGTLDQIAQQLGIDKDLARQAWHNWPRRSHAACSATPTPAAASPT